jgi:hypothetical protein
MSWMGYGPTGVLAVTWRTDHVDRDPLHGTTGHGVYDEWAAVSTDGGHSFGTSTRLSSALSTMPSPTSQYWGLWQSPGGDDFSNLVVDQDNVHVVWGDWRTSPTDPTPIKRSMYYARVPFAPKGAP